MPFRTTGVHYERLARTIALLTLLGKTLMHTITRGSKKHRKQWFESALPTSTTRQRLSYLRTATSRWCIVCGCRANFASNFRDPTGITLNRTFGPIFARGVNAIDHSGAALSVWAAEFHPPDRINLLSALSGLRQYLPQDYNCIPMIQQQK